MPDVASEAWRPRVMSGNRQRSPAHAFERAAVGARTRNGRTAGASEVAPLEADAVHTIACWAVTVDVAYRLRACTCGSPP